MHKSLIIRTIFFLTPLFSTFTLFANVEALAGKLLAAHEHKEPIPNLSPQIGPDRALAYQVQTLYVKGRLVHDKIAGFKAGLTAEASQKQFGINRPISGVLFASGDLSKNRLLLLKKYQAPLIQMELGFITKKPILKTVQSVEQLKSFIKEVVPVIEFPDFGFKNDKINARDLIAANAASAAYIIFKEVNWIDEDINAIAVTLTHQEELINQGMSENAMGDQWEALRWLVNHVIANGWTIEKGNLLITGSLGEGIPAKPGMYRVQYNDGPKLEFTCR